ncbi:DedA family protein [Vibrio sp. SM6]|uniref:DedA family protein n=1 Tax=Vibrio agarilyticus TaxID=2726741 RepID=A0A7X8TQ60_9VIBR|nr:YqaA family protein [Vibrio agarilyticus]NLS12813.1 DedA family protein [Vibrio agarilyticus]
MLDFFDFYFSQLARWFSDSALWVLFLTGFLSATLLPGGSEASLIATLSLNQYSVATIIVVATAGNTLGGMTNYWLGLFLPNRTHQQKHSHKAIKWLSRYGYWGLLFSWLPLIGDVLCLAAGWLRMQWLPSIILIAIGKAARYGVLAAIYFQFI